VWEQNGAAIKSARQSAQREFRVRLHLLGAAVGLAAVALLSGEPAAATDAASSVVIRAGKTGGAFNILVRELVDAIAADVTRPIALELEESQGSVQNVMDAAKRGPNEVFTATPTVVQSALRREKPFDENGRYDNIRALFPIPFQTTHWVVRADSGVAGWADLTGKSIITGARGSLAERQTSTVLAILGLEGKVALLDIDAANASAALREGKVAGFAITGPFPIPSLAELAKALPIGLLGVEGDHLTSFFLADDSAVPVIIPAGTYAGIDRDVPTVALPVGAYTTTKMSEAAAHTLTKAFWTHKAVLGRESAHWQTITPASLATLGVRLHPGALRYYKESGIAVPRALE
jgi:TRAP transporter TAXI family solute receptor